MVLSNVMVSFVGPAAIFRQRLSCPRAIRFRVHCHEWLLYGSWHTIYPPHDLISRTGVMASINMVPLFLGGRTNIMVDILGVSVHSYYLAHHWIGRVVVVQGLIHAGLVMSKVKTSTFDATQVAGLSVST